MQSCFSVINMKRLLNKQTIREKAIKQTNDSGCHDARVTVVVVVTFQYNEGVCTIVINDVSVKFINIISVSVL